MSYSITRSRQYETRRTKYGVLRFTLLLNVKLDGFVDDITVVVCSESIRGGGANRDTFYQIAGACRSQNGVCKKRRSEHRTPVITNGCPIISKWSLKQLCDTIDDKLNCSGYVVYTCKKSSVAILALSKSMSNSLELDNGQSKRGAPREHPLVNVPKGGLRRNMRYDYHSLQHIINKYSRRNFQRNSHIQ